MNKPECRTDEDGTKEWLLNGKAHREDGPAIEYIDGTKEWILNGKLHREDGPAIEDADGDKYWYLNGKLHREDGPAVEDANGDKDWFLNGVHADPDQIVDLWLMRGKFCFYDKDNDCLNFG
jgi:hypothetical protein